MLNISKYLEKIKKNLNSGEVINSTIVEIINRNTGLGIKVGDFELRNNQILLKISPLAKNKIFIFKEKIKNEIEKETAIKNVDIR